MCNFSHQDSDDCNPLLHCMYKFWLPPPPFLSEKHWIHVYSTLFIYTIHIERYLTSTTFSTLHSVKAPAVIQWWPHLNFALRFWSRRVHSCRTALSWWHSAPLAPRSSSTALGSSGSTPAPSVRCELPSNKKYLYVVYDALELTNRDYWLLQTTRLLETTREYWRLLEITREYWTLLEITREYWRLYYYKYCLLGSARDSGLTKSWPCT